MIALAVVLCFLIVGGGLFFATGGKFFSNLFGNGGEVEPTTTTVLPPVVTFSADPTSIIEGQTSELLWQATGADSITIDHEIGSVNEAQGTRSVSPSTNTTYTLTATNSSGSVSKTVTVNVTPPGLPEIVSFTVSDKTINIGKTTTLRWEVKGATSISIDRDIGEVVAKGSKGVSPMSTTTYTLTATNAGGSKTATVTVTLASVNAPVIISFTASPTSISAGQTSTLEWNVTGATSLSIDHNIGAITPVTNGSMGVTPTVTTIYTLSATNDYGTVRATARVTILPAGLPIIVSFEASPISINVDGYSTLQWNVIGATSLSINENIVPVNQLTIGTEDVAPMVTTIYTLTATNSTGSISKSVTITVASAGSPVVNSFSFNPANIGSGGSSTLSWSTSNAASVTIKQGLGNVATSGSLKVTPNVTTTYTLTATNTSGSIIIPVTITVDDNVQFYALPSTIIAGQEAILNWNVLGASSVIIDPDIGQVTPTDSLGVYPDATTTYTLTADSIVLSTTVTVNSASAPVIDEFTASAVSEGTVTLSWKILNNATQASISPGVGNLSSIGTGSEEVAITQTTTFTLAAKNSSGTVYASVTVPFQ